MGLGYDIADLKELCGDLDRLGYHMREMRIVDDEGRRRTGFATNVFREIAGGRFVTVRRGDLATTVVAWTYRSRGGCRILCFIDGWQGSALAMTATYVLAGELARAGGRRRLSSIPEPSTSLY